MSVIPSLNTGASFAGRGQAAVRGPGVERLEERSLMDAAGQRTQFVHQLYHDLLRRTPGLSEVAYWSNALTDGAAYAQVAAAVGGSDEYLGATVAGYYEKYFGRQAGAGEVAWWVGRLRAGVAGRNVEAAFLNSDEFYGRYSSGNNAWLDGVYRAILGRGIDTGGLNYWTKAIQKGTPRDAVVGALLDSREGREKLVTNSFQTYLRRAPDAKGLGYGLTTLAANLTPWQFTVQLVSSTEYSKAKYIEVPASDADAMSGLKTGDILPRPGAGGGVSSGPSVNSGGRGSSGRHIAGDNIRISNNPLDDNVEMSIAVNPTDPNNIVIYTTAVTFNGNFCDAYISFDGGNTWTVTRFDQTFDGIPGAALNRFDPTVVFDSNGRLYVGYGIDDGTNSLVIVGRSADGGRTFQTTIVANDPLATFFHDKWILAAGPAPGNPSQQNVYIAWTRFNGGATITSSEIVIAGSVDGGVTFSAPAVVSDTPAEVPFTTTPAVGANGEIYLSFMNNTTLFTDVSTTFTGAAGSFNFGADRPVRNLNGLFGGRQAVPPQPGRGIRSGPVLVSDRNSNRLYITYTDTQPGGTLPDTDIFVVSSADGGVSWSAPVRVNDDATATTQFNPWIAVDNTGDGCVGVMWRDPRNDPANQEVDIYAAVSTDGGLTFGPNQRISTEPSDDSGNNVFDQFNNFAEYDGIDFVEGQLYFAWADNRNRPNQNKDVFYDTLVTECGFTPEDGAEPNETSDRPTDFGLLRAGTRVALGALNVNRHRNGLPDYDWYRFRMGESGTFTANIGPATSSLELQLFKQDDDDTLIQLASDVAANKSARSVSARVRKGDVILVEVKGRNNRLGRFGQGAYTLDALLV